MFNDINDHDFNSRVLMGLDIYAGSDADTRESYEYIFCGVTGAVDPTDVLHKKHPRLLSECPRGWIMDCNAMVYSSSTGVSDGRFLMELENAKQQNIQDTKKEE